jgi:ABC-type glycerol-3-phosphate transport system substrate-binding protein
VKKFKKAMALSLALAMGLSLCACGKDDKETTSAPAADDTTAAASDADADTETESAPVAEIPEITVPSADGAAIQVYSWNDELGSRLDTHFRTKYPELSDLVVYNNLDMSGTSDEYSAKLQAAVDAGGEMVPSIIAADNDVAVSFMMRDYVVPVSEIGITAEMYANAYDYTVEYATIDGQLKAVTWQATPGVVAYRTDIAEEVLGFSDPESVQAAIGTWDDFFAVAEQMKAAGKYMVSGPDDIKYAMLDQRSSAWVVDGALNIDPAINTYLEYSKKLYDNGYTNKTAMWSSEWTANMAGDVFCYFGCTWFIPWSLSIEDTDAMGKYNVVTGPCSYHWGGTYLMVTNACPNKELAALVLYTMCCDVDTMYNIFDIDTDFCNNKQSVANLIADGKGALDKLGGQNPLEAYDAGAKGLSLDMATSYDATFNSYLDSAAAGYNAGDYATIDDAIVYIKEQVSAAYSDIVVE